jgi:hypothetical protein
LIVSRSRLLLLLNNPDDLGPVRFDHTEGTDGGARWHRERIRTFDYRIRVVVIDLGERDGGREILDGGRGANLEEREGHELKLAVAVKAVEHGECLRVFVVKVVRKGRKREAAASYTKRKNARRTGRADEMNPASWDSEDSE